MGATVLYATAFAKPWNTGHYVAAALEAAGLRVVRFDPGASAEVERGFMAALERERPSLLLISKGDGLEPAWIEEARRAGALAVMWFPDSGPVDAALPWALACDHLFTMARGRVPEYRAAGVRRVTWLSEGFAPQFHTGWRDLPRERYGSDVTFVGNLGRKPYYLARRPYLRSVAGGPWTFKWWGPRPSRSLRDTFVKLGWLGRSWGREFVWGPSFAAVANYSGVFLAFDAFPEVDISVSKRTYTATGCGAFYLCRYPRGIEELFVPGEEIEVFHDKEEMLDKIRFYLAHEEARRRIAEAGRRRTLSCYTYDRRVGELLRVLREEHGFTP